MHILCVGMMVYDVSLYPVTKNIFNLEKWDINLPLVNTGGDALNVATTLAKLDMSASVIGRIGEDINGKEIISISNVLGVDTSGVIYDKQFGTAVSYMLIEENGERHPLSYCDIYAALDDNDVTDEHIQKADIVYFGSAFLMKKMDDGGTQRLFKRAHQAGKITAMDAAMDSSHDLPEQVFKRLCPTLQETDIFIPSYSEAKVLTGQKDPIKIAECFKDLGIKIFGIKLGAEGCFLTDFNECCTIESFKQANPVDTTGAGDSFMGAFLCAYAKGWSMEQCGIFANAVASHNVAKVGATAGIPKFNDVIRFIDKQKSSVKIKRQPF